MKDNEQFVCKQCGCTEYTYNHTCERCGGQMIVEIKNEEEK